jgi:hypothetical protein
MNTHSTINNILVMGGDGLIGHAFPSYYKNLTIYNVKFILHLFKMILELHISCLSYFYLFFLKHSNSYISLNYQFHLILMTHHD